MGALADQLHPHPVLASQPTRLNARDAAEVDCSASLSSASAFTLAGGLPPLSCNHLATCGEHGLASINRHRGPKTLEIAVTMQAFSVPH